MSNPTPRTAIVTTALTPVEARALDRLVGEMLLRGERATRSSVVRALLLPHISEKEQTTTP